MTVDRRYELNVAEFSMAGYKLREQLTVSKFYIDAKRPEIKSSMIINDAVGTPDDGGVGNRNYTVPRTNWVIPPDADPDKWIQCNQDTVEFKSDVDDQFIHNLLEECDVTGQKEDGIGVSSTSPTASTSFCGGELTAPDQGRQTITVTPKDSCGISTNTDDLVWDTDLPSLFETKDFQDDPRKWFTNTSGSAYTIQTELPARTTAGEFPKHYSVDCNDNFMDNREREDGDGGQLDCQLLSSNPDHDDGCNPIEMSSKYYHVCGGAGTCEDLEWAVYTPLTEDCTNVQCEPGDICCENHPDKICAINRCYAPVSSPGCTNPKGGSSQDGASGCSDLGLYNCHYDLPCNATNPGPLTGASSYCIGKRQGLPDTCSFSVTGTCTPNSNTSWQFSTINNSGAGTCSFSGTSYTEACNPTIDTQCVGIDEYRAVAVPCSGTNTGTCQLVGGNKRCSVGNGPCATVGSSCTTTVNGTCNPNAGTSWQSFQPSTAGTCSVNNSSCTVNIDTRCTDEYRLVSNDCPRTFSGTCGVPVGGCSAKDEGGGNLSQEQCDPRGSSCNPSPICLSAERCCDHLGDTFQTNPTHCPSDCVNRHGKACCTATDGGNCTGQLCCQAVGSCQFRELAGDGTCRPTCEYLAKESGYGYGADGQKGTDDDTFIWTTNTCAYLNTQQLWGSDNWITIPLIGGKETQEFVSNGNTGECCGRPPPGPDCKPGDEHPDLGRGGTNDKCPVNGECGSGTDPRIPPCDLGDEAPDPDNPTDPNKWICEGKNDGDDSEICGDCDPTSGECCQGDKHSQNGGSNDNCPLDGKCGDGDGGNWCTKGSLDPNTPMSAATLATQKWNCLGIDGESAEGCCHSSNLSCVPRPIVGKCGKPCEEGTEKKNNDGTHICEGEGGDSPICPLDGECSKTGCSSGTSNPAKIPLTSPEGKWRCLGIGGGKSAPDDSDPNKPCPRKGKCSDSGCEVGKKTEPSPPDGTWICEGIGDGGRSGTCGGCGPAPVDGACSATGCAAGEQEPPGGTTWICKGENGYSLDSNGACNSATGSDSGSCGECSPPALKGVCGDGNGNWCKQGDEDPSTPPRADGTWTCKGTTGQEKQGGVCASATGSDDSCPAPPIKGKCGDNTGHVGDTDPRCAPGTPEPSSLTNPATWICKGENNGGDSPTCGCNPSSDCCGQTYADNPDHCRRHVTDGKCAGGSYDHDTNAGTCGEGTPHQLASTSEKHCWECRGTNEGKTDRNGCCHDICACGTCRVGNSTCPTPACNTGAGCNNCAGNGSGNDTDCCSKGVFIPGPPDGTNQCNWTCRKSSADSSDQASCTAPIEQPECGTADGADDGCNNCARSGSNGAAGCCAPGSFFHGHPGDDPKGTSNRQCNWTCRKSPSSSTGAAECSAPFPVDPPPKCACASSPTPSCGGNSLHNTQNTTCCAKGYIDSSPADTTSEYNWTCAEEPSGGGTKVCETNDSCSLGIQTCTGDTEFATKAECEAVMPDQYYCYHHSSGCYRWKNQCEEPEFPTQTCNVAAGLHYRLHRTDDECYNDHQGSCPPGSDPACGGNGECFEMIACGSAGQRVTNFICGQCATRANGCIEGIFSDNPPDTSTHYKWRCYNEPRTGSSQYCNGTLWDDCNAAK